MKILLNKEEFLLFVPSRHRHRPVPRLYKSPDVLNRPKPSLRVLRTNNAKGRLRTLKDVGRFRTPKDGTGRDGDGHGKKTPTSLELINYCLFES